MKRLRFIQFKKHSEGAAIVEFALLSTLLILIAFGIISFGFVLYNSIILEQASKTAVRAGINSAIIETGYTNPPPFCESSLVETDGSSAHAESTAACVAKAFVDTRLISLDSSKTPEVTVISSPADCEPGPDCFLTVNIKFNNVGIFAFDQLDSNAQTSMYYE